MSKPKSIQNRRTPPWVFGALNQEFGQFRLDACAEPHNALCKAFYTREHDGLAEDKSPWRDVTFCNPPFKLMERAMKKAFIEATRGVRSVLLGPTGCTQEWFHTYALYGTVYVPDVRISYNLPDGTPDPGADRDTMIFAFGREHTNQDGRYGIFRVRPLELSKYRPKGSSGGRAKLRREADAA